MRRHATHEHSPSKRRRDRSNYNDRQQSPSPRRSHPSRYKKYSESNRHSPKRRVSPDRRMNESFSDNIKSLCIRKFSSKLGSDIVQQYLYREFGRFGDLSISIGNLEGERTALLNFKYAEDAREALYSKPTIDLHDRVVNVVPFCDMSFENDTKISNFNHKRMDDSEYGLDNITSDRRLANKLDPNFGDFLAKSGSLQLPPPSAPGPTSLLGMPGIASSAMVAAAARALGLNAVSGALAPPQLPGISSHNHQLSNARSFDNRMSYSSAMSDNNPESKATRTLFVGSLEPDITETEVRNSFERYGFIEQIDVKRSAKPGVHCYAFVRFQNIDQASRAKISMSGRFIRSLHCKIGYGKPIVSQCIYIGGLETWNSIESLQNLLIRFGQLSKLDWTPGRKYAIVLYENSESAVEAHTQLKGLPIAGRSNKRLRVDFVNPDYGQVKLQQLTNTNSNTNTNNNIIQDYLDENHPLKENRGANNHQLLSAEFSNRDLFNHSSEQQSTFNSKLPNQKFPHSFRSSQKMYHLDNTNNNFNSIGPTLTDHDLKFAVNLQQLDNILQPDLWRGQFLLKNSNFLFRSLLVIGNREVGEELISHGKVSDNPDKNSHPILHIKLRGNLDPSWMAEAMDRVHAVLSTPNHGLCLMLVRPDLDKQWQKCPTNKNSACSLHILITYLKLKQATGIILPLEDQFQETNENRDKPNKMTKNDKTSNNQDADSSNNSRKNDIIKNQSFIAYLFAPSSFALSLLKQIAPKLSSDLATNGDYMVLMAIKR